MRRVSPWTRSPAAPSRAGRGDPRRGVKRARVSWRDDSQGRSVQRTNPGPPQAHSHGGRALVLWVGAAAWVKRRCHACDVRALRQQRDLRLALFILAALMAVAAECGRPRYRPAIHAAPPKSGSSSPPRSAARCIMAEVESREVTLFSSRLILISAPDPSG